MKESKIAMLVPSRNRPNVMHDFAYHFNIQRSGFTDLFVLLDKDDDSIYPALHGVKYLRVSNDRRGIVGVLNKVAKMYASIYDCIGFMGDDHRPKTQGWDEVLYNYCTSLPNGIAYGNDLLMGEYLPTHVVMDSNVIEMLGFMAPDCLQHMYVDNFWKDLGTTLGTLKYFPDIVVEHLHWAAGKAEKDADYQAVDSFMGQDGEAYTKYRLEQFEDDVRKIRG